MMTTHAPSTPRTTFAGDINPFAFAVPRSTKEAPKRRKVSITTPSVKKVLSVICATPGLTSGDLIERTRNMSAGEYAKMLLDLGEVQAVYKQTKPGHIRAVRHFYPTGEMQ